MEAERDGTHHGPWFPPLPSCAWPETTDPLAHLSQRWRAAYFSRVPSGSPQPVSLTFFPPLQGSVRKATPP